MKNNKYVIESNEDYRTLVNRRAPTSPILKDVVLAFLVGGFLCFCGQWLAFLFLYLGLDEKYAYLSVTVVFIILASIATSLGFFDRIARFSGAGTLVPVTGFSNSVTSMAIDTRSEGFVLGVGSKIFTVAGPVILYSTLSGTLYGLLYCLFKVIFKQ